MFCEQMHNYFVIGYMVNSASISGGVLYIAGQPRYNHTGQVIIYRMTGQKREILQRLSGEQVCVHITIMRAQECC